MEQLQCSTKILEFCAYDESMEVMDTAQMLLFIHRATTHFILTEEMLSLSPVAKVCLKL